MENKEKVIEQFYTACSNAGIYTRPTSIGTLGEKQLHIILKNTIDPCCHHHEIKVGRYHADIKNDNGITEIQTRSLNALRKKLDCFLPRCQVRIVYPIPRIKHLVWIDNLTGEVTKKRKSPKKGSFSDSFRELYKIKMYLGHPNLIITLMLIDMTEYRNLDGWSKDKKKGSTRYDRIPEELVDYIDLSSSGDFVQLIPPSLPSIFTVKEFASISGITEGSASMGINILKHIGIITPIGKQGRAITYQLSSITNR